MPSRESRAKLLQACPTLCNPTDCSPPGSSVHGIVQARTLGGGGGLPFPSPGDLSKDQTRFPQVSCTALAGGFLTTSTSWEALTMDGLQGNYSVSTEPAANRGDSPSETLIPPSAIPQSFRFHPGVSIWFCPSLMPP